VTNFANQHSTEVVLFSTEATGGAGVGVAFGFDANTVRVVNHGGVPIEVNLNSTAFGTTGDPELSPFSTLHVSGVNVAGLGLMTSSTTSSTGSDGHRVTVSAWGH